MGKEYGSPPSKLMQQPIDEFLFDWRCTIELMDAENEAKQTDSNPTRFEYDEWQELVNLDLAKEKEMKIKERKQRHRKN